MNTLESLWGIIKVAACVPRHQLSGVQYWDACPFVMVMGWDSRPFPPLTWRGPSWSGPLTSTLAEGFPGMFVLCAPWSVPEAVEIVNALILLMLHGPVNCAWSYCRSGRTQLQRNEGSPLLAVFREVIRPTWCFAYTLASYLHANNVPTC